MDGLSGPMITVSSVSFCKTGHSMKMEMMGD